MDKQKHGLIKQISNNLQRMRSSKKALVYQKFFKTQKGEYGEGDIFLGISIPQIRKLAKLFHKDFIALFKSFRPLKDKNCKKKKFIAEKLKLLQPLLKSKIHEERFFSMLVLINLYRDNTVEDLNILKKEIFDFYLNNASYINNWDLVDVSASHLIGNYLFHNYSEKDALIKLKSLAKSRILWERRIAIIATHYYIKKRSFKLTIAIAKSLINDPHDLIHKAVGWMLREVGKIDIATEKKFLEKHTQKMPRTMLRYAIEKFDEKERLKFLCIKKINISKQK